MSLWLKAEGYTVVQINQLPTVVYAINIVASWLGTTLAAIWPAWTIYTFETTCVLFSSLCMIIWNIPKPLKSVSYSVVTQTETNRLLDSLLGIFLGLRDVQVQFYIPLSILS